MKKIFILFSLLISSVANASYSACRTDGCEMRRNDQVAAVLNYLRTSIDMEGRCYGLNQSLLAFKRLDEATFSLTCGTSPRDNEKILLKLTQDQNGEWLVQIKE